MSRTLIYDAYHSIYSHYPHVGFYTIGSTAVNGEEIVHLIDRLVNNLSRSNMIAHAMYPIDNIDLGKAIQTMLYYIHFQLHDTLLQLSILLY